MLRWWRGESHWYEPQPAEGMTAWRVGKAVGNVKNIDPSLIEPLTH
jgi:putative SOS response-associated peptidase YedK